MASRRQFIGSLSVPAAAAALGAIFDPRRAAAALAAAPVLPQPAGSPNDVARDEAFWFHVAQAFTVDRSVINLNNGGVSPAPGIVQNAMKRHLDHCNSMPPPVALWRTSPPQREAVRRRLAAQFGAHAEEIAITRNASESLQTCQFGMDLEPGDEVLTTNQDYPRMLATFRQRARREGIVLKEVSIPTPCEQPPRIVAAFEEAITPRTRMILLSHMVNITGQILPAREVIEMARPYGIPVIVDGAHALAHFDFRISDLGCDYYATSLHKWLFAPHGTGLLYVRREKIAGVWPLMAAAAELDGDIRKFEEIGTHPAANYLAIAEALTFHQTLGPARKEARLIHLRNTWADRLTRHGRVRLHTSLRPGFACGIATVQVDGVDSVKLSDWLWDSRRILVTAIVHPEFEGIRVSPSVYTTMEEIERFCEAMEEVIRGGLPA